MQGCVGEIETYITLRCYIVKMFPSKPCGFPTFPQPRRRHTSSFGYNPNGATTPDAVTFLNGLTRPGSRTPVVLGLQAADFTGRVRSVSCGSRNKSFNLIRPWNVASNSIGSLRPRTNIGPSW